MKKVQWTFDSEAENNLRLACFRPLENVRFVQFVFNYKSVRFVQSVFKSYQGDFYKFVLFVIMPA